MENQLNSISIELYKEILGRGQDLEIKAGGSSMWPFIKDGETLIIRKTPFNDIARGDVIASIMDQRVLCHRVFKKNDQFIQTKADALVGLDAKISQKELLGKVIAQKRENYIQHCDGWMPSIIGVCIAWGTLIWAPMIPMLRRVKKYYSGS